MKCSQMRKNYLNWVDLDLKMHMSERDIQHDIARISKKDEDWILYRKLRNSCTKLLHKKKSDYMSNLYKSYNEKNDAKFMYRTTKEILGWTNMGQPSYFLSNGVFIKKPVEMANLLLDFYNEKTKNLMSKIKKNGRNPLDILKTAMRKWEGRANLPVFTIREITLSETLQLISLLGNSTASGRDKLDSLSIKCAVDYLAPLIHEIINLSIRQQRYIMKWKISVVTPILKSKEHSHLEPSSYRPISLLPVLAKLTERALQLQMQQHLERHHLLHPNVHAYRKSMSTSTSILQITDAMYQAADSNLMTSILALDQSAAFDCVSHTILIQKLYNFSRESINWIVSYLSHRTQQVKLGRHVSKMTSIKRGVPQGSILGPLLYLIYTNEIAETLLDPNCTHRELHSDSKLLCSKSCKVCGILVSYADDITLVLSHKLRVMNQLKLNLCLAKLEEFLSNKELAVNVDKTAIQEEMIKQKKGRTRGDPPHLIVEDPKVPGQFIKINDSKQIRLIGANFQSNMGWQAHLVNGKKAVFPSIKSLGRRTSDEQTHLSNHPLGRCPE